MSALSANEDRDRDTWGLGCAMKHALIRMATGNKPEKNSSIFARNTYLVLNMEVFVSAVYTRCTRGVEQNFQFSIAGMYVSIYFVQRLDSQGACTEYAPFLLHFSTFF